MPAESKALVRIDPQQLLASAVDKGATVETLERLVSLAKDVRAEQARAAWYEAMSEFQRRCPTISKNAKANIATAKGYYSYKYATLDEIMASIRPLLGELGLSVFWASPPQAPAGHVVASCRVAHVLGHVEESGQVSLPVPDASDRGGGNPLQRIGSALSYARRYSLMSIMGISPEDDDDGQSGGSVSRAKDVTPPQTAPQPRQEAPQSTNEAPPPSPYQTAAEQNEQAVQEWLSDIASAESLEKLSALWHTLTAKNVWSCFTPDGQVRLTAGKDARKAALSAAA